MSAEELDVSRETLERLKNYEALLKKWNPAINLVSKSTLSNAWTRHIIDSAQVYDLAKTPAGHWVDLGSGGGFPGMVIAILAMERAPEMRFSLIESDARKCTFLRTVARESGAQVNVVSARIEDCPPLDADVVSARALADLKTLMAFVERHLRKSGEALFLKGETWRQELRDAQRTWRFEHEIAKSKTKNGPAILRISGVTRV